MIDFPRLFLLGLILLGSAIICDVVIKGCSSDTSYRASDATHYERVKVDPAPTPFNVPVCKEHGGPGDFINIELHQWESEGLKKGQTVGVACVDGTTEYWRGE